MFRDNEEDESLKKNNPVVHYRFKRKIEFLNCHLQLYIAEDKIKFIVNCIEDYSEEFKEYSNEFSLYQFQELSKYFNFFEKIEDILEDLASILKLDNYDIEKNSNTMTVILHVSINEEFGDVNLTLFRKKTNNNNSYKKPAQIVQNIKNSDNKKRIVQKSLNNNKVETEGSAAGTNVGVKSIRELNNLLTELKDRITVLEVTQNTSQNPPIKNRGIFSNNLPTSEKLFSLGSSSLVGNENVLLNMDSIIKRINRLEEANTKKSEKIKYLEEKLKVYDPMFTVSETDSMNDNNFNFNNVNYNYINLGSIKKKDTNTMNSNNTNLNNTLLEIKEELNSSSSSKHRNKSKNKGINNKDNNVHESDKKNKSRNKDKDNNKEKKHKSKSKSKSKNKKKQEKESHTPNKKNINYNNNNNNKDNNEVFIDKENNYNNKQNKSSRKKSKSRNSDKIKEKNLKNKEEIICTDIKEPKNRQSNMRKIVHEVDEKDSERLINNLEKYLNNNKNKNKNKDKDIEQNINENEIKRNSSFNKDNNEIGNSNNIEKKNSRNYDNNVNDNDNNDNDKDDRINNNISNVNNMENNDNNISNHYNNNDDDNEKKDENSNKNSNNMKNKEEEKRKEESKRKEHKIEKRESESNENSIEIIKKNEKKNKKKKILPIVEKENIKKYVNSEIIFTKKELKLLKTKINNGNKNLHVFFDFLYRATEDGDNADIIKKKIKDIHKTLTLFYTEEGARFGIYIEKEIRYSIFGKSLKEKEGTSFLISLNNCIIYDILGENIATENKGDMLCFIKNKQKNKNGTGWAIFTPPKEFLRNSCILGDVTYVFDIEDNDEIIGDKNEYHLKEVEIFEVAIEEGDDYNNYEGEENIKIKMNNTSQNDTNENNISNNKSIVSKDEKKNKVEYTISTSENNYSNNINNKDKNNPSNDDKNDDNNEFYLSGIIKGIHDK